MNYFCLFTMIVTLLSFSSLHAQTTEAEIESRLLHKSLFLRGQWSDSRLSFDEQGHLVGKSDPVPFTLAGIDVDSVKLVPGKLSIAGHRMGIVFKKDLPERVQVINSGSRSNMPVKIEIKSPVSGDWKRGPDWSFSTRPYLLSKADAFLLATVRQRATYSEGRETFANRGSRSWMGF